MRTRSSCAVACLLLSSVLFVPAASAQISQRLEDATADRDELRAQLEVALAEVERLEADVALSVDRVERLRVEAHQAQADHERAVQRVEERVRVMYMEPSSPPVLQAVTGTIEQTAGRLEAFTLLNRRDDALIEEAEATQLEAEQVQRLLADEEQRLREQLERREQFTAQLQAELDRASRLVEDLRSRAERQVPVDRGPQQGVYACIFDPDATSFIDSWGFPRSGGRSHKGTDVMAARSEPVYAFTSGTIDRLKTGGLGGVVAYVEGDDGARYYYAHLEGYVEGLSVGQRVEAGEQIAFNGDSGNARGGPTHVHFQVDAGGGPVNPYPWLREVC